MKKKGQITKNDSGMMNSEVYHFTTFPGTATSCKLSEAKSRFAGRQAASHGLRAASGQENLFVALCGTSVSSVVKKELNTESTKKAQRNTEKHREKNPLRLCALA